MSHSPKNEEYQEIREALTRAIDDECRMSAHLERLTHRDPKGLERLREIRKRIDDLESLLAPISGTQIEADISESPASDPRSNAARHSPSTQHAVNTLPKV